MPHHDFLVQACWTVAGLGLAWLAWLGRLFLLAEVVPDSQSILAGGGLTVAGIGGYIALRIVDGYNARQLIRQQTAQRAEEAGLTRRCDVMSLENTSLRRKIVILESDLAWYQAQHGPGDTDAIRAKRQAALRVFDGPDIPGSEPGVHE